LEQLFTSAAASVVVVSFVVPCDDVNNIWYVAAIVAVAADNK